MLERALQAVWGPVFAWGYDRFQAASEAAGMRELRRSAVAPATGRTLEIGAGTGLNHDLYPAAVTELVLTEPAAPMAERLRAKVESADRPVRVIEAPGERLPFADDSFDTVTFTMVLCTAPDPPAVLAEAARVLAPGGRLLFLEHVRSPDPRLARWQARLHGPWYLFGNGCHCNRDFLATLEASELEVETVERGSIPRVPPLVRPRLTGSARAT